MTSLRVLLTFVLVAFAPSARAADDAAAAFHGTYYFYTFEERGGRPVCSETWRFADDGTLTVTSGQEVTHERFRTEPGSKILTFLFRTFLSSNGLPDCSGVAGRDAPKGQEQRLITHPAMSGGIVICQEIEEGPMKASKPVGHLFAAKPD